MSDAPRSADALRRFVWEPGDIVIQSVKPHGEPEPGYYLLFTDGNRDGAGPAMIGGFLMYRKKGQLRRVPDGWFSKEVNSSSDSIDDWEYEALIEGLKLARQLGVTRIRAYMDRHSVVDQVNGKAGVASSLRSLHAEVEELTQDLDFRLSWIPREMNAEADAHARSKDGRDDES